jgi:aminopeptidase N
MGPDFNFTEWCDTWLNTSGINILEPVIIYENGLIKSLHIKQSCDLRGKNRLRSQKLNVAFYNDQMVPTIIKDIIISSKDPLTALILPSFPISAIIINYGDHAYAKVRYDENTLKCFEENLSKMDYLERALVWRHMWNLVIDAKMSSM